MKRSIFYAFCVFRNFCFFCSVSCCLFQSYCVDIIVCCHVRCCRDSVLIQTIFFIIVWVKCQRTIVYYNFQNIIPLLDICLCIIFVIFRGYLTKFL